MGLKTFALAGFLVAASMTAANAVTFVFSGNPGTFGGTSDTDPSISGVVDGIGLEVFAFEDVAGGPVTGAVTQAGTGLGVANNPENQRLGGIERLVFVFDRPVRLQAIQIAAFGDSNPPIVPESNLPEPFSLAEGNVVSGSPTFFSDEAPGAVTGATLTTFDLGGQELESFSLFGTADGLGNRGIRVRRLEATVVPLPATLALLTAALAGMGLAGRWRAA